MQLGVKVESATVQKEMPGVLTSTFLDCRGSDGNKRDVYGGVLIKSATVTRKAWWFVSGMSETGVATVPRDAWRFLSRIS